MVSFNKRLVRILKESGTLTPEQIASGKDEQGRACVQCHVTGYGEPNGFVSVEKAPDLVNVGCESCHGARLKPESLLWRVGGLSVAELLALPAGEALACEDAHEALAEQLLMTEDYDVFEGESGAAGLEKAKAQIRSLVEHPFHVIKNRFGHRKVRYRGLAKNTAQLFGLFALANLVQTKDRILAQGVIAP